MGLEGSSACHLATISLPHSIRLKDGCRSIPRVGLVALSLTFASLILIATVTTTATTTTHTRVRPFTSCTARDLTRLAAVLSCFSVSDEGKDCLLRFCPGFRPVASLRSIPNDTGPRWVNPRRRDHEQAARHVVLVKSAATSAIPYAITAIDWVYRVPHQEIPRTQAWPHRKQRRMEPILEQDSSGSARIGPARNAGHPRRDARVISRLVLDAARRSCVVLMRTTPSQHGSSEWR